MSDQEFNQEAPGYGGLLDSPTLARKTIQIPKIIKTTNTILYPEMTKPSDLQMLASANFSTESLTDPSQGVPDTPSPGPKYTKSPVFQPSVPTHHRANSNTRARPKSAIFMMDSSNAISEDGSPIQSPINNTPRSRNSIQFGQKMSYVPVDLPPSGPPVSTNPSHTPTSPSRRSTSPIRRSNSPVKYLPFNFQPQEVQNGQNLQVKPAHRKGHKYKHSSVSMNLFQETPIAVIQPLSIPNLYPIPNFKESLLSITSKQKLKLTWSIFHLSLSLVVFVVGFKFKLSAMSTLAHLIFYDSLGSIVIVFVDIMSNFEVWNNSSIAYPFGLGRLEVLAGFALSSSLIMVSFDLISHFLEEFIILIVVDTNEEHDGENHSSHHIHGEHGSNANWFVYEFMILLTVAVTFISSNLILKDDRITEMISEEKVLKALPEGGILGQPRQNQLQPSASLGSSSKDFKSLTQPAIVAKFIRMCSRNPTHLLTLMYSIYLIVVPILPTPASFLIDVNEFTNLVIALLLCFLGCKLTKSLGGILLCSYPYSNYDYHVLKAVITDKILSLDFYKNSNKIEKFFITKFNYQLYVIGLKISIKGISSDDESRLKFEINRILKKEIDLIDTDSKLEVTIDISRY